jgi:hypothetical protein
MAQRPEARACTDSQRAAVRRALTWRLDALRWVVDDVEEQVMEAVARVARARHEGILERLQLADCRQVHLAQPAHYQLLLLLLLLLRYSIVRVIALDRTLDQASLYGVPVACIDNTEKPCVVTKVTLRLAAPLCFKQHTRF